MENTGYWIFNCNPKMWALDEFLSDEIETSTWKVTDWQKDYFKKGQLGLIRVGVDKRNKKELNDKNRLEKGIYAVVQIMDIALLSNDINDNYWNGLDKQQEIVWRVKIKYIHNFLKTPILLKQILKLNLPVDDLASLKGRQTSSWALSEEGFNKILELGNVDIQNRIHKKHPYQLVRISLRDSIDRYLKECKISTWVSDEAYKFEFANYVYQNVKWDSQSNEQILDILEKSQKLKYTGNVRGIQFVLKSGREKLSEFISIEDVRLLRRIHTGENPEKIDWKGRSMSFTGLSAWLASLFPNVVYPVPLVGFNETIKYIFVTDNKPFPKKGKKYLFHCQSFMRETEELLKQYPLEDLCLQVWNQYYESNPELGIKPKNTLSKVDWVWLVQDFHLFVHRKVLGLYKKEKKNISIAEDAEPTAVEGNSKLATHMRYERNSALIRKIKQKAIQENKMLNCEVCGFSFLGVYGEIGEGFIEAHHINPLSEFEGKRVTKKEDIALVCSNCHRMLHRTENGILLSIKELKGRLKN